MHRHWGLSIDRQAQQILARDRLIRQLSILALALSAIVFILAIMLLAVTRSYASESCMTKAEARAMYPKSHLYWHGTSHCWNDKAGSIRYRTKHKSPADAGQLRAQAPKPQDASGNSPAKKILWPSLVPTVEFSFQSFLVAEPMTLWPPILDVDEVTADLPGERRLRNCCWPPMEQFESEFEKRWSEIPPQWQIQTMR